MANIKHVGRLKANQRKVAVAFRVLPNDPDHALIVDTATLSDADHDSLMKLIESDAGQQAHELADAMDRAVLSDGARMLPRFHATGRLQKVPTNAIEMTPNNTTAVLLSEINSAVAENKGVTVADLAMTDGTPASTTETVGTVNEMPKTDTDVMAEAQAANLQAPDNGVISDEDLAASYRSQADRLFKEAKRLREQAEELVPTKKKKKEEAQFFFFRNQSGWQMKRKRFPADVIRQWPEVFKDIDVQSVPMEYINTINVTFKNGKEWAIDCKAKRSIPNSSISKDLEDLFEEYGDTIKGIDFRIDSRRVKRDIEKQTNKFWKKRK